MQGNGQGGDEEKGKARAAGVEEGEEAEEVITGSSGSGSGVPMVVLPHELVAIEVLTRLPVKPLMRFKCVSKLWRSTISKDPAFFKARRVRQQHSALFITYPAPDNTFGCFYATIPPPPSCEQGDEEESAVVVPEPHQFTATASNSASDSSSSCKFEGATEVIDGLVCLHAGNRAWICNITTREIRELPFSKDLENAKCFNYFFGCASSTDDNKKEYKLLKLCLLPKFKKTNEFDYNEGVSEILTLGKDLSWRRPWTVLNDPDIHLQLHKRSVHVDGFLCCWSASGYSLTVLNFKDESFQTIGPPPKASGSRYDEDGSVLLQFRGHFALLRQEEELSGRRVSHGGLVNRKLDLWVLEKFDRDYKQLSYGWIIGNRNNRCASYKWINHVIDVPCDFPIRGCSFLGNLALPHWRAPHACERGCKWLCLVGCHCVCSSTLHSR